MVRSSIQAAATTEVGQDASEQTGLLRRITVLAASAFERELHSQASEFGVFSYLCTYCPRKQSASDHRPSPSLVRIEILADAQATERMMAYLREHRSGPMSLTATVEAVG